MLRSAYPSRAQKAAARLAAVALLVLGVLGASAAAVQAAGATRCELKETHVINSGAAMIREKLWGFTGDKAPYDPVFGWVDVACADRGSSRSIRQDLGKRFWFNVAGPEGASAAEAKLSFSEDGLRVEGNTLGIAVDGLTILGEVAPRHACVYVVTVWTDSCPPAH